MDFNQTGLADGSANNQKVETSLQEMLPLIDRFSSWVLLILKAPIAIQWG
jgi:hypothetical protein